MDKILLKVLISEIENQCEMVKIAVEGINRFHNEEGVSGKYLWFNVQGLLIATANISKILWNYQRLESPEVVYLKEILKVDDSSKVKSRFFRNLFEHYDEHLIKWSSESNNKMISTLNIMPKSTNIGISAKDTFKTYYSDVNSIIFQGKEYELKPIIREVARIFDRIKEVKHIL